MPLKSPITVGQLRAALEGLPDNTVLVLSSGGDYQATVLEVTPGTSVSYFQFQPLRGKKKPTAVRLNLKPW